MENRVGEKKLSDQKRAQVLKIAEDIIAQLNGVGVVLSTDERKRVLRPRKGADLHMATVHRLAEKYAIDLKGMPLSGMGDDLALGEQLVEIENKLRVALTIAEDTGAQADSEAWEAFLGYYGVLNSMAQRNPELAEELVTVVEFMANGPRKKKT